MDRFERNYRLLVREDVDAWEALLGDPSLATNIHIKNNGRTLIHLATQQGKIGTVRRLLDMGIDVNARSEALRTALHYSLKSGLYEISKLLVEKGANVNLTDTWGRTPLHEAIQDTQRVSPASKAVINMLIDRGANIDATDSLRGYTPLHYAIVSNNVHFVEILLKRGAFVNAPSRYKNQTPLHVASSSKYCRHIAELLLRHGANIDALDVNQSTPLHYASKLGIVYTVQLLLERGANVNARDNFNNTPLLLAVRKGYLKSVSMILNHFPNKEDERVLRNALDCIEAEEMFEMSRFEIHKALENYGFRLHDRVPLDSLWLALTREEVDWDLVKAIIEAGSRIDQLENNEWLLCEAISDNREDVVEMLIKNGASITPVEDSPCDVPLLFAIQLHQPSTVKILLANGAEPNRIWSKDGLRPIHWLVRNWSDESEEILKILMEYGADINMLDDECATLNSTEGRHINRFLSYGAHMSCGDLYRCPQLMSFIEQLCTAGALISDNSFYMLERSRKNSKSHSDDKKDIWLAEVDKMKRYKLVDGVSLHHILVTEQLGYLSDPFMVGKLDSIDYGEFPEYKILLINKMAKDKRRNEDLIRARESFHFLVLVRSVTCKDSPSSLPPELVSKIISHLDKHELENLALCGISIRNQLISR